MTDAGAPSVIDTIATALEQRLAHMSPGERLPTVRELMASFGVSQVVVQRALSRLKDAGLISAQVGRGTFVTGRRPGSATTTRNVLVLSYEQQSDRADELTRLLHRSFLKRDWRSAVLTYGDFDQASELIESLPPFDACVVQSRGTTMPLSLLARLKSRHQALVIEGYAVAGVDVDGVAIDWLGALSLALRHLYDHGHRRIAIVTQSLTRASIDTAAEFRRLHAWAGLSSDGDPVVSLPADSEDAALEMLERHLREGGRGTDAYSAYIVYPRAFHGDRLIRSFAQAGLSVPGDVAVVTLGYTDLAHEHAGRLDTVGQSALNVAEAIAATVEARWQYPDAPFRIRHLPPELVARSSAAAARPSAVGGR